jgi:ABC-type phosphate transport system ATPase subunit
MDLILEGFSKAFSLILHFVIELFGIILLSLKISCLALCIAAFISILAGAVLGLKPQILFLDEPTASIDEDNTRIIEDIVKSLKRSGKTTVIITTHDREQAMRLADSMIAMRNGRISDQK